LKNRKPIHGGRDGWRLLHLTYQFNGKKSIKIVVVKLINLLAFDRV
jgi:hypothetical protein